MQHFEVSGAVRPLQSSLGVKRLTPLNQRRLDGAGNTGTRASQSSAA